MNIPGIVTDRLNVAAHAANLKGGEEISAIYVGERLGLADAFLLISGGSERQVEAIAEAVEDELRVNHEDQPLRREGRGSGRWVLLDYGDIVIHVQHVEDRDFYGLDRIWADAPAIELAELQAQEAV
ncbi:ribosome silencing factor [Pseudoglutamicibacter cumminsii]|uniref:ribosome silencing factor n=1 Tax=Pseudoglutamicibacter cumminsii TaxID=156979 RepID=UPI0025528416|nr:ribosome silencing factor [Pseudoglutamicibacter cumminsii]MDZ3745663.1 ribosome silencing factor [Pseudoglutamicibacter cumminsii]